MTYQWTPPRQQPPMQPPGGVGGGNGLLYALIGLVAVLIVIVGIVVALALGVGRAEDSGLVATPAPPAPAADDGRPDPTGDAASDADADAGAGARPIDVGSGSQDWGSQCPDAGSSSWYPICDDCFEHPGYGAHTGSPSTSCAFASNVAEAIHLSIAGQTPTPRTVTVQADSPVTGQTYTMSCVLENRSGTDATYHCTGGNNAVVFVGIAG